MGIRLIRWLVIGLLSESDEVGSWEGFGVEGGVLESS